MKKITKVSLLAIASLGIGVMTTSAKVMTAADIDKALTFDSASGDADPAYIFGKHVYVNEYTIADSVGAANTLDGQTDAVLYYKNGKNVWTNAVTSESIDKESFSMEMVKLIGEANSNGYVSYDSELNAERVEQIKRSGEARVEDVFEDENSPIQITSIRKISTLKDFTNSTTEANDIYKYNIDAISVNYSANTLNLTESSPLLEYYNDTAKSNAKWIALLIKTNKDLTDEVKITLGSKVLTKNDMLDGTDYGASTREFMVWVNKDSFSGNKITLEYTPKDKDSYTQTITVNYKEPKVQAIVKNVDGEHTISMTTPNTNYKVVKTGEKNTIIFYANEDVENDKMYFTYDGNNKLIKKNTTEIVDLITVKDTSVVKNTKGTNGTQDYLTVEAPVKDTDKENSYTVNIVTTKNVTSVDLLFDFMAELTTGSGLSDVSGGESDTDYQETISFADGKATKDYTNSNSEATTDKVTINFVLKSEIPIFEVANAKLVDTTNIRNIDSKLTEPDKSGAIDRLVEANVKNLNSGITVSVGDGNGNTKDIKSIVNVKAINEFKGIELDPAPSDGSMTYSKGQKLYALVIELSNAKREDITMTTNGNGYAIGIDCSTDKSACTSDLSSFGATGNEFIVVLDTNVTKLTFKNKVTDVTTDVKVALTEVKNYKSADPVIQGSDSVSSLTDGVRYDKNLNEFVVENGITNFLATINGKEYAFTCTPGGDECKGEVHLQIVSVSKVNSKGLTGDIHGRYAYNEESITPSLKGNDTIDVSISRTMNTTSPGGSSRPNSDWFALLVKFDSDVSDLKVVESSKNDLNVEVQNIDKFLPDGTSSSDKTKYAVLWVHSVREANELTQKTGEVKTQVLKVKLGDSTTVEQEIKVNTTRVENATDLKTVSARKIPTNNGNELIKSMGGLLANQKAIQKVEVVDGIIKIHINKSISKNGENENGFEKVTTTDTKLNEDSLDNDGLYIAILADLNSTTTDGARRYEKYARDNFDAKANETLIWLKLPSDSSDETYTGHPTEVWNETEDVYCYEIEFTNNNTNNSFNKEKIKIEVIDESEELKLTVDNLDANTIPKVYHTSASGESSEFNALADDMSIAGYKFNQSNFAGTYESKDSTNTLTINPLKENVSALKYSRNTYNDDTLYAKNEKFVAFRIDFGTEVIRDDQNAGIGLEKSDGTSYILFVNIENATIKDDGADFKFKSTYDKSQVFTLKIKSDSKVKAN